MAWVYRWIEYVVSFIARKLVGTGKLLDLTYQDTDSDLTAQSTYTLSGMGIGTANTNRRVLVAIGIINIPVRTVTGVTIGGVSATELAQVSNAGGVTTAWYYADVPTGTTANVVITLDASASNCHAATYRLVGENSMTPTDTDTTNGSGSSQSTTVTKTGQGVALSANTLSSSANSTWSNLTEDIDNNVLSAASAALDGGGSLSPSSSWGSSKSYAAATVVIR